VPIVLSTECFLPGSVSLFKVCAVYKSIYLLTYLCSRCLAAYWWTGVGVAEPRQPKTTSGSRGVNSVTVHAPVEAASSISNAPADSSGTHSTAVIRFARGHLLFAVLVSGNCVVTDARD